MYSLAALVVAAGLATVTDQFESSNHLANGEEAKAFRENNPPSSELHSADVASGLESVCRGLDDGAVLDGFPQVLVICLKSRN